MQNEQPRRHPLVAAWLDRLWQSVVGRPSSTTAPSISRPATPEALPQNEEEALVSKNGPSPSDLLEEFYERREVEDKLALPAEGHSHKLENDMYSPPPMPYVDPRVAMRKSACGRENATIGLAEELRLGRHFPGDEIVIYSAWKTKKARRAPIAPFYTPGTQEETFKEFVVALLGNDEL